MGKHKHKKDDGVVIPAQIPGNKLIHVKRLSYTFDREYFALDDILRRVKEHKKENKEA